MFIKSANDRMQADIMCWFLKYYLLYDEYS